MKSHDDRWPQLENRMRSEPSGPGPSADHTTRVLRAVRVAGAPERAGAASGWLRWGALLGAGAAAALLLMLKPPTPPAVPAVEVAPARWSVMNLDRATEAPLQRELESLQGDLGRTLSFLAACWPSGDPSEPSS